MRRKRLTGKVFGESAEYLSDPLLSPKDVIEQMRRLGKEISYKEASRWVLQKNRESNMIRREGG